MGNYETSYGDLKNENRELKEQVDLLAKKLEAKSSPLLGWAYKSQIESLEGRVKKLTEENKMLRSEDKCVGGNKAKELTVYAHRVYLAAYKCPTFKLLCRDLFPELDL